MTNTYPVAALAEQAPPRVRADDDLLAVLFGGRWKFLHKEGTPY